VVNVAWATLGINVLLSLVLMRFMQHAGIALANSISVSLQVIILYHILAKRGIRLAGTSFGRYARMIIAAAAMGACLYPFLTLRFWLEGFTLTSVVLLMVSIVSGVVVYFGLLWIMGLRHILKR